jgi:hypothetical protein
MIDGHKSKLDIIKKLGTYGILFDTSVHNQLHDEEAHLRERISQWAGKRHIHLT